MENALVRIEPVYEPVVLDIEPHKAFITANTTSCSFEELRTQHHIPVFVKDNEPVISQLEFIETVRDTMSELFPGQVITEPEIRLSHPIKGRISEAKYKPASELNDWEKTIYYERMAFIMELPTIQENINGNRLSLTVGGVKAYNLDNLNNRKGAEENFKVFIGFQNKVCTNMCISSDGYVGNLKVQSLEQLKNAIEMLFRSYSVSGHINNLKQFVDYSLTEQQFALLVGRCRMYQHLPKHFKDAIYSQSLLLTDTQLGNIVRDYYQDLDFGGAKTGKINLWDLYNLFTGANKTTYIDSFADRSVNAYQFIKQLQFALDNEIDNWFLN